uniref:Uncharacterized protein n=1 Tax=Oryza sativa subsp. japonica TaxID=39947 RepID=Q53LK0_ORYSJ|nr:hypothetical protein [Oryza sativa Japonica Group]
MKKGDGFYRYAIFCSGGFLIKEAVRTCLLARRWLHLWKSATGLRIGEDDIYLRCVKDNKEFLDRLLLLRDGAPLDTCVLRFRWLDWYRDEGLDDTVRVNHWFRHALLHKVRFLLLDVDIWYRFPFLIDEMPLVSRHLTRLQLKNIGLNDSFLNFSSCPALEHLVFESCKFDCAKISSSSAKRLSITNSYFSETSRIRIAIPSLVSLKLDDFHGRTPVLEWMPSALSCILEHALVLENLILQIYSKLYICESRYCHLIARMPFSMYAIFSCKEIEILEGYDNDQDEVEEDEDENSHEDEDEDSFGDPYEEEDEEEDEDE